MSRNPLHDARVAAEKALWDKRGMMPEHSSELVEEVIAAALPDLRLHFLEEERLSRAVLTFGGGDRA